MVYWLISKVLPIRIIAGVALIAIGLELGGVTVIDPVFTWLSNQFQSWIGSQLW